MSSTVARTWKVIKPHVPLIHFKKGGRLNELASSSSTNANRSSQVSISETMLPKKYFRKPMSDAEMQTIELGGVETL